MSAIFQKDFNVIMGGAALLCCCHGPTKLSPQDVEYLQQNTRLDEASLREWHQGFIQDCPNGKLKPEAFVAMYREFFPASKDKADVFCGHVYRLFDTDSNGYIDFKEFIIALHASKGSPRKRLQWAFR